jgi:hypothetical protein
MNIRGNQKWTTQRNWQHREHKTKKSKTKTQHNSQTNTNKIWHPSQPTGGWIGYIWRYSNILENLHYLQFWFVRLCHAVIIEEHAFPWYVRQHDAIIIEEQLFLWYVRQHDAIGNTRRRKAKRKHNTTRKQTQTRHDTSHKQQEAE